MPDSNVRRHIERTLQHGDFQSDQPRAIIPRTQCRMDNFSDALILNQACNLRSEPLMDGIMLLPRKTVGGLPHEDLRVCVDGTMCETLHYGRYWHGGTFLTRILLVFADFQSIRFILYILSSILMLLCGVTLWRRVGWVCPVAILLSLLFSYLFVMQFSVQLSMVLLVALAGVMAVANGSNPLVTLFIVGSATAYLDLLTAPMLTLGLPLVALVELKSDDPIRHKTKTISLTTLMWVIGYGATWGIKWVIASLFTHENVVADGLSNLLNRSSALDGVSRWQSVLANVELLPWKYIVALLVVMSLLAMIFRRAGGWKKSLPYLPLVLIPYVWYFFAANHSYLHCWFTFRAQAVSLSAIILAFASLVDWQQVAHFFKISDQ